MEIKIKPMLNTRCCPQVSVSIAPPQWQGLFSAQSNIDEMCSVNILIMIVKRYNPNFWVCGMISINAMASSLMGTSQLMVRARSFRN
nr:hypothetical protein [Pedobacter xixiisoli]